MVSKGFNYPASLFCSLLGLKETSSCENFIFGSKTRGGVVIEQIAEEQVVSQYSQLVQWEQ